MATVAISMLSCPRRRLSTLAIVLCAAPVAIWATGCNSADTSASANGTVSNSSPVAAETSDPAVSPRPKLRPGAKTVAQARAGDRPYDKTFDDLRFQIEPGQEFHRAMLPDAVVAMAGQRIRIRGFILPTPQKRGIRAFVLVRDNQECCFGPGAALYDCILVEMQPGKTAEFSIRPVAVEGTFDIREIRGPDGKHLAIYHLEGESVR
jgi:hypothetical protein